MISKNLNCFQLFTFSLFAKRLRSSSLALFLHRLLQVSALFETISSIGSQTKHWVATEIPQNGSCSLPSPERTADPAVHSNLFNDLTGNRGLHPSTLLLSLSPSSPLQPLLLYPPRRLSNTSSLSSFLC